MDKPKDFGFLSQVETPEMSRMDLLVLAHETNTWRISERPARNDWLTQVPLRSVQWLSKEERINERLRQASLALRHCVEVSARKLGGVPVLKGTRFPIAQVLSQIAEGDSPDDLAENFDLDRECLRTLLHALAACLDRPFYR